MSIRSAALSRLLTPLFVLSCLALSGCNAHGGQNGSQKQHEVTVRKGWLSRPMPLVHVPPPILAKGYESGFKDIVDAGAAGDYPMYCNISLARRYLDGARDAFRRGAFDAARTSAYGAIEYTGRCHSRIDHPDGIDGDAFLLMSKAELRLGMLTAGKNDADAAAASYVECTIPDNDYDDSTMSYCDKHRVEAEIIVRNG